MFRRGTAALGVGCGKIFTRIVDANAHFPSIVDYGLAMWQRQDAHQPEPDEYNISFSFANYS
jgi:hypothetical protein